jgi:hypothetical protein
MLRDKTTLTYATTRRISLLNLKGKYSACSRILFGQTNSIAILFRLTNFYCDALMYFHSAIDTFPLSPIANK